MQNAQKSYEMLDVKCDAFVRENKTVECQCQKNEYVEVFVND